MKTYITTDASDLEIQNLRSRQANLFERQKKHQESIDCLLSRAESFPESYFALHDGSAVVRLEQLRREMDHIVSDRIRCTTRQMTIHDETVSPLVRKLATHICQSINFEGLAVQLSGAVRDAEQKLIDAGVSFKNRVGVVVDYRTAMEPDLHAHTLPNEDYISIETTMVREKKGWVLTTYRQSEMSFDWKGSSTITVGYGAHEQLVDWVYRNFELDDDGL